MKTTTNTTTSTKSQNFEWAYCKVAYLLDVQEVIWPMVALVKAADIWEPKQLVDAVLSGEVKTWEKVTKKGIKQLFRVLKEELGIDAKTLNEAAKLYV